MAEGIAPAEWYFVLIVGFVFMVGLCCLLWFSVFWKGGSPEALERQHREGKAQEECSTQASDETGEDLDDSDEDVRSAFGEPNGEANDKQELS